MDIKTGYRHIRLHPKMRDWFIFCYTGRYFRCIELPFLGGSSPLWFTQLISSFVCPLRGIGMRVVSYLDDIIIQPSPCGTNYSVSDCHTAVKQICALIKDLRLKRHESKG